ncbi:MAG: HD domain-containing protein [Planctomycetes bacterium]|nr:HD domain-containing protein [Planctomycetota bacterium]
MGSHTAEELLLVVTESAPLLKTFVDTLSTGRTRILSAASAPAGIDIARREEIVLCIIDMSLPSMSGVRLLQELDRMDKDIAFLAVTPENDAELAYQAVRAGAYDFVTTPVEPSKVSIRLRVALERRTQKISDKLYKLALEERVNMRTQEVWDNREKIKNAFVSAIAALERALQAKHGYTEGHSKRVAAVSVRIAKALNLPRDEVRNVELGALFHDIGKIGIHDQILNKPGKLTEEEYEEMKLHPLIGEQILAPIEEMRDIMHVIKHEHERWDGRGYPSRLSGEAIPLGARIVAIADAYDAIVTDRSYHRGEAREKAIAEIQRCSGTQFDPVLVEAFVRVMQQESDPARPINAPAPVSAIPPG